MLPDDACILGIESSCDETGAAVVRGGRTVCSNVVASQMDLHDRYGGVVPELASRRHIEAILPVIDTAIDQAGVRPDELAGIAATRGPGLVGSLLVGMSAGKALALAWDIPYIGVNHIEGHLCANFLGRPSLAWPYVCLTVSGGHTELVAADGPGTYRVLGRTTDDAAGEAFDKVGRLLGLPYPAGPHIDRLAEQGDPERFRLPRAWMGDSLDFSFSGLKTAAALVVERARGLDGSLPAADIAAGLQEAIVDVLAQKTVRAAAQEGVDTVLLAGGVAANRRLRERLQAACEQRGWRLYAPELQFCTDNAAMIAGAGYFRLAAGNRSPLDENARPGLSLDAVAAERR